MMTIDSVYKNYFKKTIAREFIYVVLSSIFCFSIYKIGEYLQVNYEIEIEKKISAFDSLPQHQILWYKLKKYNLYDKNYEDFKKDYKNTEDQITLFNLISNNGLYTKKFSDFRVKYFKKESVLDDLYSLYYNDVRLNDAYIQNQKIEFWIDLRKKEEKLKEMLKIDSICVNLYSRFVKQGYKNSIETFKNLIFEPFEEELDIEKIKSLEKDINKDDPEYIQKANDLNIIIILLLFPFRYIVIGLRWSIKQINKKNNVA